MYFARTFAFSLLSSIQGYNLDIFLSHDEAEKLAAIYQTTFSKAFIEWQFMKFD